MADGGDLMRFRKDIVPGPDTTRDFRTALGHFSTGVTVVTAMTETGPIGMTANSFSSVSLDPPLVMWCPAKSSARYPFFEAASHFAIHVLGADQQALARQFAKAGNDFSGLDVAYNSSGVPLIDTCLARFECAKMQSIDAGDHAIQIGLVQKATLEDGDALVFYRGEFGVFANS